MREDRDPDFQQRVQTTSFLVPFQGEEIPDTMVKGQTVTIPEDAKEMPPQLRGEWGIAESRLIMTDSGPAIELKLRREFRIRRSKP